MNELHCKRSVNNRARLSAEKVVLDVEIALLKFEVELYEVRISIVARNRVIAGSSKIFRRRNSVQIKLSFEMERWFCHGECTLACGDHCLDMNAWFSVLILGCF